jgi:hypothetical protein
MGGGTLEAFVVPCDGGETACGSASGCDPAVSAATIQAVTSKLETTTPLQPPLAADLAATAAPALQRFGELLRSAHHSGQWLRLLLAKPHAAVTDDLQRVVVRPLQLRGQPVLNFVYSHATRDITKNLPLGEGLALIDSLLGTCFRNAHLSTPQAETQLSFSKRGKALLGVHPRRQPDPEAPAKPQGVAAPSRDDGSAHDRAKQRYIDIQRPFLVALGITNAQHQLVPAMARKWKQVNKFLEIFDRALQRSPLAHAKSLRVVDFGAGKAYLSFALHDWLQHGRLQQDHPMQPDVVAVELRPDLVQQGNDTIRSLGLQGMRMVLGDVRDDSGVHTEPMDVMVALHACDTATDHALHLGVKAGAGILLCSPCCHKQLRPQLLSPHPLRSVFQHGIHAEQQAEMLTDSIRALLLQAHGYDTQVFEFVALEHTRKNKMILAVKRAAAATAAAQAAEQASAQEALEQVQALKGFFGIREHCLESLLRA